ncbi:MAG TPA: hypothetical protein VF189_03005 [Patescibacteria group bacterium]
MQENKFLEELQIRATEQKKLHSDIPFPAFFSFISTHLGNHPWKPLIPISVLISILFYFLFGKQYIEFVLWIFKVL